MMIQLENVTKFYGSFQALGGLTVDVQPGVIGLLGPNGAGKSTLIKALLGLVRLSGGSARVFGLDVRTDAAGVREQVGYMPEDDCIIPGLMGVQSVALAGELAGLPALTALRRAHEILDSVLLGEERYREVQTYSTGMRQRVKLAQALIHAPKLLFLDEPTNGLDPVGREKMLALIRSLSTKNGVSVVISTHILGDIEASCDAALILGRGRLRVYDTIERLRQQVDRSSVVRVHGDVNALSDRLVALGFEVERVAPDALRVHGGHGPREGVGDDVGNEVLLASAEIGAEVREIKRSKNSLEDIYLEAVRATEGAAVGGD